MCSKLGILRILGPVIKRSLASVKPRSKPFSVCPTLLSKHHFVVNNSYKAYGVDWKSTHFLKLIH